MKQLGLTDARLVKRSKRTRKEQFLDEMSTIIPWQRLLAAIEPHYPRAARGRRRVPLETLLRIHLLQHFFNYSDPAMEEALYEVPLASSSVSTWRSTPSRTRPRSASSGICSSATNWPMPFSPRSTPN